MTELGELTYTVQFHDEGDGMLWASVVELPGVFASGESFSELDEALREAIGFYLSSSDTEIIITPRHEVAEYKAEYTKQLQDACP